MVHTNSKYTIPAATIIDLLLLPGALLRVILIPHTSFSPFHCTTFRVLVAKSVSGGTHHRTIENST
jgi:hypothetical protein